MSGGRGKTFWTILISGSIAVALPVAGVYLVRLMMARMITKDNAGVVFSQFQIAINHGNLIYDPVTAAAVAEQAYRDKTSAVLLDGWGKRMHVYAVIQDKTCALHVQSAGPDGNFGGSDDLDIEQTFELTAQSGVRSTNPNPPPDAEEQK